MKAISTPFRYPGAKTRLASRILEGLPAGTIFVDAFVGGGSVFIESVNTGKVNTVVVNDLDRGMCNFWRCIGDSELGQELCHKVMAIVPTVQEHSKQREMVASDNIVDSAFSALFLNRTSFSGILTSGPIGGYEQKSRYTVGCRYKPDVLAKKVNALVTAFSGKMTVHNDDFASIISRYDEDGYVIYCDPPYFVKGNQLYRCKMMPEDHRRLADSIRCVKKAKFIISYDDDEFIEQMYTGWTSVTRIPVKYSIEGKNRDSWNESNELIIRNF